MARGSTGGASTSRSSAGSGARRRPWSAGRWILHGTLRANVITARCSRGITWTRALTATGYGRTGRTPSRPRARARWKIAAGRRVMNAGSVRPWAPRSRSARPGSASTGGACFPWLAGGSVADPASTRPAVQHLVVRYAKRGKMRFASHRDVARAFERGVRRAGLPIAYSAGFTPHPKISYPGGAPTGVASEAEYLSLALTARQAETQVCQRLNAALPDGIDVIDVTEPGGYGGVGNPPYAGGSGGSSPRANTASFGHLEASEWRVVLPGVGPAAAQRAVTGFLALSEAPVERLTDKGVRRLDARAAVVEMNVVEMNVVEMGPATADPHGGQRAAVTGHQDCAILRMVVLHTAPAVRPEDVLTALREQDGIVPSSPPMTTRLAQGPRALLTGTTPLGGEGVS